MRCGRRRLISKVMIVGRVVQERMGLELAEKIGPQSGDNHELTVRGFEGRPQQAQEARGRHRRERERHVAP